MQWDVDNRAHNPKVGGSNPPPATKRSPRSEALSGQIREGLSGDSGAGFYTFFYTAGWDAPRRTGPPTPDSDGWPAWLASRKQWFTARCIDARAMFVISLRTAQRRNRVTAPCWHHGAVRVHCRAADEQGRGPSEPQSNLAGFMA